MIKFKLFVFLLLLISQNLMAQLTVDYNSPASWISQPEQLKQDVDVFYVYPTIDFSSTPTNMQLSNDSLKALAIGVYKEQASVFADECNVFAPFYPQMSIAVLSIEGAEYDKHFRVAFEQVKASFQYYLENLNDGRPFFLAGHSQGSLMLLQLMKELFENQPKQLIAAYIIGYSVTNDDLINYPWLKIARQADDIGVIITYNTQSPDAVGSPVLMKGAQCVNPLIWSQSKQYAPSNLNKGAVFFNKQETIEKEIQYYTDAQIREDGVLIVNNPNPDDFFVPGKNAFPRGVFHKYDYQFFYRNLQENVKTRKIAYLKKP